MDGELRVLPRYGHHEPPHAAAISQRPAHEGDAEDDPREHHPVSDLEFESLDKDMQKELFKNEYWR